MFIDIHSHQVKTFCNSVFNTIIGKDMIPNQTWFSLGVHPWYIHEVEEQFFILKQELETGNPNLLFIGECGLDKVNGGDYLIQEKVFRKQIVFSEAYQKPLIIHCVKAYNELITIKKELTPVQPWIIHGFNRKKVIADSLLESGVYLSFGMSFLNSLNGIKVLKSTPLNKIFFETDDNNEFTIEEVYILASKILNINIETLKDYIKENLWQIIGWKEQSC